MADEVHPLLVPNASDRAAQVLRGLAGGLDALAPGLGSTFSELVAVIIPNQRQDRIAEFVTRLHRRMDAIGARLDELARSAEPEKIALFEDGLRASAKATATERIERVAALVATGLASDEAHALHQRQVLSLLEQLSDTDLAALLRYAPTGFENEAEGEEQRHWENPLTIGAESDLTEEDREARTRYLTMRAVATQRLLALGLLHRPPSLESRGARQELSVKLARAGLTALGVETLKALGVPSRVPVRSHGGLRVTSTASRGII